MRFVFAAPPGNFIWPKLTQQMQLKDILASYFYFGMDPKQQRYLEHYLKTEELTP